MGKLIVMFVKKKVGKLPLKMLKMGANCCQNVEKIEQLVVENSPWRNSLSIQQNYSFKKKCGKLFKIPK